ncbi:hypothetical protein C8R47DRAFT_1206735 [Mycena vitilis]|nr:hypothetical protein C8R47DRAFT_1206735 [Mycena vitilis]
MKKHLSKNFKKRLSKRHGGSRLMSRNKRGRDTLFEELTLEDALGHDTASFTAQHVSQDGRRTHQTTHTFSLPSPLKKKARQQADPPSLFADAGDGFEYVFEDLEERPPAPATSKAHKPRAKRYLSSDRPLQGWVLLQDEYLAELIRLEGRGDVCVTHCPTCPATTPPEMPRYRCKDCMIPDLFCKHCCLVDHARHPLHRIEYWDGTQFTQKYWDDVKRKWTPLTLKEMGLRVQLGHCVNEVCEAPQAGHKNFTVIHNNSIHDVAVDFCGCKDAAIVGSRRQQLLRRSWFPATHREPQTCSTFVGLETFHIMTLQGKVTTYDYYSGLEKLTDNTGLRKVRDRYKAFMRTMREWRQLFMLKRGGRGNDGDRLVAETRPGELAVVCPACPQPGVNLPEGWDKAQGEEAFLYFLYLAIDACFRLKRRLVSSEAKDPGLGTGWSYFTEDPPFRKFLLTMSTCSGLAALDYANTKFSRGYGSTGVALGVCARHEFVQRNAAVDLQKGERYVNMDYLTASMLRHISRLLLIFFSYDICCQWSKSMIERLKKLPPNVRLTLILELCRFVIPKLHIYGHKILCQIYYSLNYTPGSARTDGEGIERPWANIGPVATSTKEMGPGSRHDTLDDHWGHWNWEKLIGLGRLLLKRLLRAIPERNFQRDSLATFTENQAEHVEGWKALVDAFEANNEKPNPYELPKSGLNENDVRLQFAREEAAEQERGTLPIHNVSPSAFMLAGLDLEEQQRRIKVIVAGSKSDSSKQSANVVEKRTKLSRYIARFRKLQAVYMPGALQALADRPAPVGEKEEAAAALMENVPLFLPSALSGELRASGCNKGVDEIELRLRDAQCRSALDQIRSSLHVKSRFRTYKGAQVRHQGATTRARNLMNRNDEKIRMHAEKYVAAWEAKRALVGEANVGWHRLNPKKDLRCMDSEEDRAVGSLRKKRGKGKKRGVGEQATEEDTVEGVAEGRRRRDPTGEGSRTISWIWLGADASSAATTEAMLTGLRVEWCKAWARTRRWTEEVCLLREEMRRVPISLRCKAEWWMAQRSPTGFEDAQLEGAAAYATKQATLYTDLADEFERLWAPVRHLEVVDGEEAARRQAAEGIDDEDEDEDGNIDNNDDNDGVDGEGGPEDDADADEEEEGSVGWLSGEEEEELVIGDD